MCSKLLVSACLLGQNVRYDGRSQLTEHPLLIRLEAENRLVPVCPEVDGGLTTPRPAAEIQQRSSTKRVIATDQSDVTEFFIAGAEKALRTAQTEGCLFALMAARSPSCGNEKIYDGSYSGKLIDGAGITASLLMNNGIQVFNQFQIDELAVIMGE